MPFARSPAAGLVQHALLQSERNTHRADKKTHPVFPCIRSEQVPSVVREVVSVAAWRRPGFGAADSAPKPALRASPLSFGFKTKPQSAFPRMPTSLVGRHRTAERVNVARTSRMDAARGHAEQERIMTGP